MRSTELVELELSRYAWGSLSCGCGRTAAHLAADLLRLAKVEREDEIGFDVSSGHVMSPSTLMEPSLPVVSVALAALADATAVPARHKFLESLLFILGADSQAIELADQGRDLVAECHAAAQSGLWLFYREVFFGGNVGTSSYAFEVLTLVEKDFERLRGVQIASGAQLADDLRDMEI